MSHPDHQDPRRSAPACWALWFVGLIGLPFGHWCLFARVEPFYTLIYIFLWWPFILAADFAVYLLRGRSLLHDRPRRFVFLALWSVPVWLFFEVLNVRLTNWFYVQAPCGFLADLALSIFCFSTVLPGVFETAELALALIERFTPQGRVAGPEFRMTPRRVRLLGTLGGLLFALMLCWPRYCFPLAWAFVFLILDPLCYAKKGVSLLRQMSRGDYTRLVAFLGGGFLCGGLWEFWNAFSRTKWIYTVPFFDELKLGEMPLLGFLGFPPFAVECYAIVNFFSLWYGVGAAERGTGPARIRPDARKKPGRAFYAGVAVFALFAVYLTVTRLVLSFSEPLDRRFGAELGPEGVAALKRGNARETHLFLRLAERPTEISPELYIRMREIAAMAELKGMGLRYALALRDLGIRTPSDLAKETPRGLAEKVRLKLGRAGGGGTAAPSEAQARVWIRGAAKKTE